MLGPLIQAFRQAVVNFRTELHRGELPPGPDAPPSLHAMAKDVASSALRLRSLESQRRDVGTEAEAAGREADVCARRHEMAVAIRDVETAAVAADFRDRHLRRRDLLREKGALLDREIAELRRDVDEMREGLRSALEPKGG